MDILAGELGKEAKYDIAFTGGKLLVTAAYIGAQATGTVSFTLDGDLLLDKLAAAIPGTVDDAVITMAKVALKAL